MWSAPVSSTPGCWRASPSRPATTTPNPLPTKALLRVLGARRSARPACRWARRRPAWRTAPARCSPTSSGGGPRSPAALTVSLADHHGRSPISHRLPRRAGRDRSQLHGARAGGPAAAHRLRAHVPRRRHARHRPRPAGLHLPAGERRSDRGLRRHPRPRGPRRRAELPAPGAVVPHLRLGADPGAGPQPDRGGGPARPDASWWWCADGERRTIGPFDVEFIPVTHSVPHAFAIAVHTPQGVDPPLRRLQAGPDARSTTAAPTWPASAPSPPRRASACCWRTRPTPRSTGTRRASARVGGGAAGAVRRAAGPAHHHLQLRQPHPPHPADRRCRHRQRPGGGHARAVDQEERPPRPRPGAADHPGRVAHRHRGGRSPGAGAGLHHLDRFAGRADVGARAHGLRRQPVAEGRRARHGDPVQPRHPGQRVQRQPGDRRAAAQRGRGRPQRRGRRARHGPRAGRRAQDAAVDRPARVLRAHPRRVPAHGGPRQARPR